MAQLILRDICFSLGNTLLLDHINLQIQAGEHICLLGRNGAGKSTLMKMIQGQLQADSGHLETQQSLRIAYLQQEVPQADQRNVYAVVLSGFGERAQALIEYETLNETAELSDAKLNRLHELQEKIEEQQLWNLHNAVQKTLSKLELSGQAIFSELSGGLKRRVLLAQALVNDPDILLLDEPTNHLDLSSIEWLQNFLKSFSKTILFTSHDRRFLQEIATRIIELDRGKLTSWPGDYQNYLRRKEEALAAEETANALFDKKLAQEETWIRQGIKARRTRNEGRVRALEAMRKQHAERRQQVGKASFDLQAAKSSGKLVIEAENLTYEVNNKTLIKNFNATIMRGDKIGIIGPNGCGKTTLINLLVGKLKPTHGTVKEGTQLEIAYFDQLRDQLNKEKTVLDNLSEGRSHIELNGQSKHVIGYLQDFLFSPLQARSPVKSLSGGECNRLLLAKLFAKPANFLILDEPTNDLDIETLELLESLLVSFSGTVLIVSHDREFLNNVVTSTFVFEKDGVVNEYVGGYDDWLRQRAKTVEKETSAVENKVEKKRAAKLSYKEQRELDELPKKIEKLENELQALQENMAAPDFYQQDANKIKEMTQRLQELNDELAVAYERWDKLENS